jgi:hypothetical protein
MSPGQDSRDATPLTPAHLWIGRGLVQIPDDLCRDDRTNKVAVQWRNRQKLHSEFFTRFQKGYVAALQPFPKWLKDPKFLPQVGELVLLKDKPKSRMFWPTGIVKELLPSRDGRLRTVLLQSNGKEFRRDIRYLYRLEGDSQTN